MITSKRSSPSNFPLRHLLGLVTDNHELDYRCEGCGREGFRIVNAEGFRDASVGSYLC